MPVYKKDINYIVQLEDVDKMMSKTSYVMHRAVVAALYLTGARPSEVIGLRVSSFNIVDDFVAVTIETKKLGKSTGFIIRTRTLEFSNDSPYLKDLLEHREAVMHAGSKDGLLFPVGRKQVGKIVEQLSERRFCPYNFRHSRMTKLANEDCNIGELMSWKGARDARSVSPYLAGKKIGRRLKVT